jgi:hypothetical protein
MGRSGDQRAVRAASAERTWTSQRSSVLLLSAVGALSCLNSFCSRGHDRPELDHSRLSPMSLTSSIVSAAPAIGRPMAVRLAGDLLWIADAATDPGLHLLDARSGDLLRSVGRRGEGPGEFSSSPTSLELDPAGDGSVWAFDRQLQRLTRFVPEPHTSREPEIIRLEARPTIHRIVFVGHRQIIGQSNSEEARFSLFSTDGMLQEAIPGVMLGGDTIPAALRLNITNNALKTCVWPGHGFAVVNFMVGRIEFHDTIGRFRRVAEVPFADEPRLIRSQDGQQMWDLPRRWYFDCTATASNLYALFSGRLQSRYDTEARSSGRFIHVFAWDGTLKTVYRLDRDVRAITVDASGAILYAASLVDAAVYRYTLPGTL